MNLDAVNSPETLYDWIEENCQSEEVFQAFMELVVVTMDEITEDDDTEFDWNVATATLHLSNGKDQFAYLITMNMSERPDDNVTYALGVSEDDGKIESISVLDNDVPRNYATSTYLH